MSDSINEEMISEETSNEVEETVVEETAEPSHAPSALVEGVMHEQNIKNVSNKQAVTKVLVQQVMKSYTKITIEVPKDTRCYGML